MNGVAVVIPCFNQGRTLEEAVESVLVQTRPAREIVVVDDGSSELYTKQVLDRIAGSKVRVVRQEQRGVAAARNRGARHTSSPYIVFLDADDQLDMSYFELAASRLDADPEIDYVSCAFEMFGERTCLWKPAPCDLVQLLARGGEVHVSSMIRRQLWDAIGGFEEALPAYEVWEFWISACERGARGLILEEPLLRYRIHSGSRSHRGMERDRYVRAMRSMVERRRPLVQGHSETILLAKEAFLRDQSRYGETLQRRKGELLQSLHHLDQEIARARRQLVERGGKPIDFGELSRRAPLSTEWGLERGKPLDRHFIERFLRLHRSDIRGRVLEVKDDGYARMFGAGTAQIDVLDIDAGNSQATVVADLAHAEAIPAERYDCFILTQTLHVIYEARSALSHAYRILAPGGVLLCTVPAVRRVNYEAGRIDDGDFWRFTEASVRRLFAEVFPLDGFEITVVGNILTSIAFLHGITAEEVDAGDLEVVDPVFPLLFCVRATKPAVAVQRTAGALGSTKVESATILLYHRIADLAPDPNGLCVPPAEFRAQMAYLRSHFRPVPLRSLVHAARAGQLPEKAVAVTLDDGYLDALDAAAPILAEFEIPATFFVNTFGLDEPGETLGDFFVRVFFLEEDLPSSLTIAVGAETLELATRTKEERESAFTTIYPRVRLLDVSERAEAMRCITGWLGRELGPRQTHRVMTAAEVRQLARRRQNEIGAHTRHHLWLPAHDPEARRNEVRLGKRDLEELLGRSVDLFAYPYGASDSETVEIARTEGFWAAVTVEPARLTTGADLMQLPRLEVKRGSLEAFVDLVHGQVEN